MFHRKRKDNLRGVVIIVSVMFFLIIDLPIANANSQIDYNKLNPYIGADFSVSRTTFKKNFGKDFFSKYSGPVNLNFGANITKNISIEVGCEYTPARSTDVIRVHGDSVYPGGPAVPLGMNYVYKSSYKLYIPYISVKFSKALNTKTNAFVMIGPALARLNAKYTLVDHDQDGVPEPEEIEGYSRSFLTKKVILVTKVGLQTFLSDHIGLRVLANWKNLSRMKASASTHTSDWPERNYNTHVKIKMKNSFGVGFGFNYFFY